MNRTIMIMMSVFFLLIVSCKKQTYNAKDKQLSEKEVFSLALPQLLKYSPLASKNKADYNFYYSNKIWTVSMKISKENLGGGISLDIEDGSKEVGNVYFAE